MLRALKLIKTQIDSDDYVCFYLAPCMLLSTYPTCCKYKQTTPNRARCSRFYYLKLNLQSFLNSYILLSQS